jgi:hypothetical protein
MTHRGLPWLASVTALLASCGSRPPEMAASRQAENVPRTTPATTPSQMADAGHTETSPQETAAAGSWLKCSTESTDAACEAIPGNPAAYQTDLDADPAALIELELTESRCSCAVEALVGRRGPSAKSSVEAGGCGSDTPTRRLAVPPSQYKWS